MGVINIEGLGSIQIAGDKPTEKEQQAIVEAMKTMPASDKEIDAKTDSFLSSPSFARIAFRSWFGYRWIFSFWRSCITSNSGSLGYIG
jgi:hypothetical protein